LRNNVGVLPERFIWLSSPDIFYKVFIPLLMLVSSIVSLIKKDKRNYFILSFCTMIIDAINRLSIGVNRIYLSQVYDDISQSHPGPDSILVVTNLWPSHIILFVEVVLIIITVKYLRNKETA
jgi:uncharacterized membrane protein YwaF